MAGTPRRARRRAPRPDPSGRRWPLEHGAAVAVEGWERTAPTCMVRPKRARFARTTGGRLGWWSKRPSSQHGAGGGRRRRRDRPSRVTFEEARSNAVSATRRLDRHLAAAALEAEFSPVRHNRARLETELDDVRRTHDETASAANEARVLAEYEGSLPGLQVAFAVARQRVVDAEVSRRALEVRRAELAEARQRTELVSAGLAERRRMLAARLAEVERRLSGHGEEREAAAARRMRLEADVRAVDRLSDVVAREPDAARRGPAGPRRRLPTPTKSSAQQQRLESLPHRDRSADRPCARRGAGPGPGARPRRRRGRGADGIINRDGSSAAARAGRGDAPSCQPCRGRARRPIWRPSWPASARSTRWRWRS